MKRGVREWSASDSSKERRTLPCFTDRALAVGVLYVETTVFLVLQRPCPRSRRQEVREWYYLKVRAVVGDDDGDDKRGHDPQHDFETQATALTRARNESENGWMLLRKWTNSLTDFMRSEASQGSTRFAVERYRRVVARASYVSQDWIDLEFASEEACRRMSNRRACSEARRETHRQVSLEIYEVSGSTTVAACRRSRRTTSGDVIVVDGGTEKHWSSTQATIALAVGLGRDTGTT